MKHRIILPESEEMFEASDNGIGLPMPTRRVFLLSGLSAVSFTALPWFAQEAHAGRTLHEYVTMFTNAMGGGISKHNIDTFVNQVPDRVRRNIAETNRMMIQGGFDNFRAARVYGFGNYFYYPVINKDGYNICMPFFSTGKTDTAYVTMVEGPSLVGLALSARDYTASTSAVASRRVLLPTFRIRNSVGTFRAGYVEPDEYYTTVGKMVIDYDTVGKGVGTVHVISTRTNPKSLLMDKKYNLKYLI